MNFWEQKTNNQKTHPAMQQPLIELDEEAVASLQEIENSAPDEDGLDEEDNSASVMLDADLRLEQGRLYQMILKHDLFGETDANPRAIRTVQRQIRKFVREQMEVMLGIRQEQQVQEVVSMHQFTETQATALKMLASRITNGATDLVQKVPEQLPAPIPKKDGITSVSGTLKSSVKELTPIASKQAVVSKKVIIEKKVPKAEESALKKPIDQMTPEELSDHNKKAEERSRKNHSALPTNMIPHPSPQQLEMMYTQAASALTIANPWRSNGST